MPDELSVITQACDRHGRDASALIEILHDVQAATGHVSDLAAREVASALNISRAEVHGVRSFYTDFTVQEVDRNRVKLCRAEACQAVGSEALARHLADAAIETDTVYCLGNCALGPAAMIRDRLIGRADLARIRAELAGEKDA